MDLVPKDDIDCDGSDYLTNENWDDFIELQLEKYPGTHWIDHNELNYRFSNFCGFLVTGQGRHPFAKPVMVNLNMEVKEFEFYPVKDYFMEFVPTLPSTPENETTLKVLPINPSPMNISPVFIETKTNDDAQTSLLLQPKDRKTKDEMMKILRFSNLADLNSISSPKNGEITKESETELPALELVSTETNQHIESKNDEDEEDGNSLFLSPVKSPRTQSVISSITSFGDLLSSSSSSAMSMTARAQSTQSPLPTISSLSYNQSPADSITSFRSYQSSTTSPATTTSNSDSSSNSLFSMPPSKRRRLIKGGQQLLIPKTSEEFKEMDGSKKRIRKTLKFEGFNQETNENILDVLERSNHGLDNNRDEMDCDEIEKTKENDLDLYWDDDKENLGVSSSNITSFTNGSEQN